MAQYEGVLTDDFAINIALTPRQIKHLWEQKLNVKLCISEGTGRGLNFDGDTNIINLEEKQNGSPKQCIK